jgi:hypothetical protein
MNESPGGATATQLAELLSPLRGFSFRCIGFQGLAPLATRVRPTGAFPLYAVDSLAPPTYERCGDTHRRQASRAGLGHGFG